jgi:hypothetical protein
MSAAAQAVASQVNDSSGDEQNDTTTPEPSLRDTILAAVEEHTSGGDDDSAASDSNRARDERGRFTAAKETATTVTSTTTSAATSESTGAARATDRPAAAATASETPAAGASVAAEIPAPQSWTAVAKAKWNEIPAEVRAEISKRESDVHRQFTRIDEERQFARQMQQTLAPFAETIRAEGGNVHEIIQNVLNTARALRTADPQVKGQMLLNVARQYGADLQAAAQQQAAVPPHVVQMQSELHQLRNYVQQQQASQQQQQAAAQQAEQARVESEIETFRSDPKHPHFDTVRGVMAALIQSGEAANLDTAYSMAVYARPDIRNSLLAEQTAQANAAVAVQQKAQNARRKGSSVRGGPGGSTAAAASGDRSLREELAAAMEEARGRV